MTQYGAIWGFSAQLHECIIWFPMIFFFFFFWIAVTILTSTHVTRQPLPAFFFHPAPFLWCQPTGEHNNQAYFQWIMQDKPNNYPALLVWWVWFVIGKASRGKQKGDESCLRYPLQGKCSCRAWWNRGRLLWKVVDCCSAAPAIPIRC